MKRGWAFALGAVMTVGWAACTCGPADLGSKTFACRQTADCVDGYVCSVGVCVPQGSAPPDGGPGPDAGPDGGPGDSGTPDAGPPDSGQPDAGVSDAGVDGGFDAGIPDGTLVVTVSTPAGVAPDITVRSDAGYAQTVSGTTSLSVPPGTYTVLANPVSIVGAVSEKVYDSTVSGSPAIVTSNGVADAGVTYAQRFGTGWMWIPIDTGAFQLAVLGSGQLDGGYFNKATHEWRASLTGAEGIAFDARGVAWTTFDQSAVLALPPTTVDAGMLFESVSLRDVRVAPSYLKQTPTSDGGPQLSVLNAPAGIAFDWNGNLYVANRGNAPTPYAVWANAAIHRYDAAQLDAGGAILPSLTILPSTVSTGTSSVVSFEDGYGIAFDSAGNLWIASFSNSAVTRYANPSGLTGVQRPAPAAVLLGYHDAGFAGGTTAILGPNGLAFDSAGSLWVANWSNNTAARYDSPGAISGVQAPVPSLLMAGLPTQRDAGTTSFAGLFFDDSDALWAVMTGGAEGIAARYANPHGLTGFQRPAWQNIVITPSLVGINGGNFGLDPSPQQLPVYRGF